MICRFKILNPRSKQGRTLADAKLSIATQRYSKTTCGVPGRDRTQLIWVIGVVFLALGLLAFGLRVMARLFVGPSITWGADDWVITAAVVSAFTVDIFFLFRMHWLTFVGLHDTSRSTFRPSYVSLCKNLSSWPS